MEFAVKLTLAEMIMSLIAFAILISLYYTTWWLYPIVIARELDDPFQIEPDPITIVCQKNEPRSYHDRFPKK